MTIQGSVHIPWSVSLSGTGTIGYYQVDSGGRIAHMGDAAYFCDAGSTKLNQPIVGMAATGDDGGYWLVVTDGGIFSYGDAQFYGSTGRSIWPNRSWPWRPCRPVVATGSAPRMEGHSTTGTRRSRAAGSERA
jgi:hypothetical protein